MTDPCAPVQGKGRGLKAEVVCLSHGDAPLAPVQERPEGPLLFGRPGEYEVSGVFMRGIATNVPANGAAPRNVAWLFHFGEINLLHPGALTRVPDQGTLETLGEVHVLLVPLGAGRLTVEAAAGLVSLLEPRSVVPVYQGPADEAAGTLNAFAGALGASQPHEEDFLRVTASNLPEQTRVVLLRPRAVPE